MKKMWLIALTVGAMVMLSACGDDKKDNGTTAGAPGPGGPYAQYGCNSGQVYSSQLRGCIQKTRRCDDYANQLSQQYGQQILMGEHHGQCVEGDPIHGGWGGGGWGGGGGGCCGPGGAYHTWYGCVYYWNGMYVDQWGNPVYDTYNIDPYCGGGW